jgi:hypothetical protein
MHMLFSNHDKWTDKGNPNRQTDGQGQSNIQTPFGKWGYINRSIGY